MYDRDAKGICNKLGLQCKYTHSRVVFTIYMIQNIPRNMIGSLCLILQCTARKMTEP
jgi:hypothetical protein